MKTKKMLDLSIVIPAKNEEENIKRLLYSIRMQNSVIPKEIIVADANSDDNTRKISQLFGAKVVKGGIPSVGRNKGAVESDSSYILFLDADTILSKNFLRKSMNEILKRKIDCASVRTKPLSKDYRDHILFGLWNFWITLVQNFYPHGPGYCIFCNKKVHQKIEGFDENIRLGEDANYVHKASRIGSFKILNSVHIYTSVRRLHKEGRLGLAKKLIMCGLYRTFGKEDYGNNFNYEFGYKNV